MRILAIRGSNLASLAGEFEVDFRAQPLASAGVFAISGPTGSGKSTLLDALCLALYHNTPRLLLAGENNVSIPDAGDNTTSPQDARNLLRRGCGECYAEVDFVGIDGLEWRASWQVQRARKKPSERLQPARFSLTNIGTGQVVAQQAKEVRDEIIKRVGLSFDQFRRSVLLAQNDFAALLKAQQNERAELLEALTSTEIFSRLSQLAHQRRAEEERALEQLRQELNLLPLLDADSRLQLEALIDTANLAVTGAERDRDAIDNERIWHEAGQKVQANLDKASGELASLQGEQERRADEARQLSHWGALAPLKPQLLALEQPKSQLLAVSAEKDLLIPAQAACQLAVDSAKVASQQGLLELDVALGARLGAQPTIAEARRLDEVLRQSTKQTADMETRLQSLATDQALRHSQEIADLSEQKQHQTHVEAWSSWHSRLASPKAAEAKWPSLGAPLLAVQQALSEQSQLSEQALARDKALADLRAQRVPVQQAVESALAGLAQADSTHRASRQALTDLDAPALERDQVTQRDQAAQLANGVHLQERLKQGEDRCIAASKDHERLIAECGSLREMQTKQASTQQATADELAAARNALERVKLAADAHTQHLRDTLHEGEPCPVCGATEHPGTGQDNAAIQSLLVTLTSQLKAAEKAEREATKLLVSTSAKLDREQQSLTEAEPRIDRDRQTLAEIGQQLTDLAKSLVATPLETAVAQGSLAVAAALDELRASFDILDAELTARHDQIQAARIAVTAADDRVTQARSAEMASRRAQDLLSAETLPLESAHRDAQVRNSLLANQLTKALNTIGDATGVAAMELGMVSRLQAAWDEGQPLYLAAIDAKTPLAVITATLKANREQSSKIATQMGELGQQLISSIEATKQIDRERKKLLAESDVEGYAARLEQAEKAARLNSDLLSSRQVEATEALTKALQDLSKCENQRSSLEGQIRTAGDALASALKALSNTLGEHCPSLDNLAQALANIPGDLVARQEDMRALDVRVSEAQAVRRHLDAEFANWQAQAGSSRALDIVLLALESAKIRVSQDQTLRAELQSKRAEDDRRIAQAAGHLELIEQRTRDAQRWMVLASLIGSGDGKKFRTYAQQFTLEVLLEYANQHLDRLAPRYQLRRGNEPLSLLVVDRDFGDEVRSVHSLSGGESFLVSLALALGLASLSSERVSVESLFIDEGFGSLDADTLNVAMEALDRLQSEGRRVGVISHVHDMAERIGTQIRVQPVAPGRSTVEVVG